MKFWKQHLTTRVASYFLLLSLVTVGIVGGVIFVRVREAIKETAFYRLSAAASLKEEEISRWFKDRERDFLLISKFPEIQAKLRILLGLEIADEFTKKKSYNDLYNYLAVVAESKPAFQEIFIIDRRNRVIVSTNRSREGKYEIAANLTYFERVESEENIPPVFYVSPITGKPSVTFATPLRDLAGKRIGVILAHLNLSRIDRIIRQNTGLDENESGETYLVGSLVTENALLSSNKSNSKSPESVSSFGIDAAMAGKNGSGLYRNYAGVRVIGVYRKLNDQDIALLVEMNQQEAFAGARWVAKYIFLTGLGSALVLLAVVYPLSRQLTQPITALTDTAQQLAKGDLSSHAPVTSEDEIGVLARSFNQMADRLRQSFSTLEAKNEELQRLDKLKDEFLANTSHELRTPLNGTIGITESMLDGATGDLTELQRQNLSMILTSAVRLGTLVNDILDFSKLKNQHIELQQRSVSLRSITEVVLAVSQTLTTGKEITLINSVPDDLPLAYADENRLQQILYNLIGNGIKFTESGTVEVSASWINREDTFPIAIPRSQLLLETEEATSMLAVSVIDTGIGISPEGQKRIFQSFEQGDGSTARTQVGTGLGLTVTKQLVELHGGTIGGSIKSRGWLAIYLYPANIR